MAARHILVTLLACAGLACLRAANAQDAAPGKYALLIGIEEYSATGVIQPLNYPVDDVDELKNALEATGWIVETMKDDQATRDQILAKFARYNRIRTEKDTLLVYFAGHGVRNRRGRSFWVTYNADLSQLDYSSIRLSTILQIVADLPPATKIVLLDHCYAGNVEVFRPEPGQAAGSRDATGTAAPQAAFKLTEPADAVKREIINASEKQEASLLKDQMVVIGGARGPAYEPSALKHGLFTYWLLQALKSNAADSNNDSQLNVYELVTYLRDSIGKYSNDHGLGQSPLTAPIDGDFVTFANLKLFSLPVVKDRASLQARKRFYLNKLGEWNKPNRQWVTDTTISNFAELLGRWIDAELGTGILDTSDQAMIKELRNAVEGDAPAKEQTRAELLEAKATANWSTT